MWHDLLANDSIFSLGITLGVSNFMRTLFNLKSHTLSFSISFIY